MCFGAGTCIWAADGVWLHVYSPMLLTLIPRRSLPSTPLLPSHTHCLSDRHSQARERVARVEALVGGLKAKARTLRGQPAAQERIEEAVAKGETMLRVTRVKLEALAAEGSRLRAQVAAGGGSAKGDAGDVALVFSNGEGALVRGVGKERSGGAEAGAGESAVARALCTVWRLT